MGQTVGEIDLGLNVNQSLFTKQLSGLAKSAQTPVLSAFKSLGKMIGGTIAVGALTNFAKECIELGSDLTEVQNVVDTTFKSMNSYVNEFAANAMASFGLSETVAKQYMGTLGAMSNSMGFSEQAAYEMASTITGLAGDVASFYNLSSDEAFDKLKSIWTGETETLKTIGVLLTQTNLDQYALNNGFGKTTASMTEQEKVMLRYQYTISALADASGDFAKTSGSWANQTRILSLQFDSLKATLGQGFINLFTPIIQMVNSLIAKLQVLAQQFKLFTELLVGNRGESSAIAGITQDTSEAISGLNGVTGAAKTAAKAVGLLSIDELNVLSEDSGSGTSGMVSDMGTVNAVAGETSGVLGEIGDRLQGLVDFGEQLIYRIKSIIENFRLGNLFQVGKDVSGLVTDIFNFVAKALKGVKWSEIGNKIGEFLRGMDWLAILESLKNVLWEAVKGAVGVWFGMFEEAPFETALITAMALWKFTGVGDKLSSLISTALTTKGIDVKNLGIKIAAVAITWEVGFDIGKELGKLINPEDSTWYENFTWFGENGFTEYLFGDLESALNGFKDMVTDWDDNPIVAAITSLLTISAALMLGPLGFVALFVLFWDEIKAAFQNGWDRLVAWWEESTLGVWFENSVKPWFTKEKWKNIFDIIKKALSEKWTEIKKWWNESALVKWWNDSVKPWFTKDKWLESMAGIKDAFSEAFKNAFNAAGAQLNKFIGWINEKMHISWDSLSIAGKEIIPSADFQLFTIPSIPMLAQGGYVGANQPQLAMIGDNKREGEIVSPESKLLEMAVQAAELASGNGLNSELLMMIIELLTRIITILENLDLDIELDGVSLLQKLKNTQKRLGHQF